MEELQELARRFHELFRGLERAHGWWINGERQANNKIKGKARTRQTPVTDELWVKHLSGEGGLGVVPINDEGMCRWGAIDIDCYDGLDLTELDRKLHEIHAPLCVCRSKSGGAHLYLFTTEPVNAKLMQGKLRECGAALGYGDVEVFPKQVSIDSEAGTGNWINMPYQDCAKTLRYCVSDKGVLTVEQFLEYAESKKVTPKDLKALKLVSASWEGGEWTEAPPCLEHLVQVGFPVGSRNNALFSMAVYAHKRYSDWRDRVTQYNREWMAGTADELKQIFRSIESLRYTYKCTDIPLRECCNRELCLQRKYGISDGESTKPQAKRDKKADGPSFLEQVDRPVSVYRPPPGSGDEPQWVFSIGGKKLDVSLDMLMDQQKFIKMYAIRFERFMMPVSQQRWVELVNSLVEEAEVFELPPDAGPEGQLMLHLEAFCNGKASARNQNELLLGRPWTDEGGMTWFRSRDFVKFCDQLHFKDFKEKAMWAIFRRHGGKNDRLMLKGKCVAVWGFPAFAKQTEELDHVHIVEEGRPF